MMLTLGLMTAIGAEVPFTAAFPPVEKVEVAAGDPESVSDPIVFPSLKGGKQANLLITFLLFIH